MEKRSMACDGQPFGAGKIVHTGDAYFRCHEFKENGKLDMEKTMSSLR
jgi:hypothetical protein